MVSVLIDLASNIILSHFEGVDLILDECKFLYDIQEIAYMERPKEDDPKIKKEIARCASEHA
jgi:hypothetical protein